jgi:hypothetical protein
MLPEPRRLLPIAARSVQMHPFARANNGAMRRSPIAIVLAVVALAFVAGCTDEGGSGGALAGAVSTTQSTAPSSFEEPGAPASTPQSSTTTVDLCAEPPGPIEGTTLTTPPGANTECDEGAGWRFFFWIGESGDPIYRVQRLEGKTWTNVQHDVACELSGDSLQELGVPLQLALTWGDKYSGQC